LRILLTGGSGQVGTEFKRVAPAGWSVDAPLRSELDLANPQSIVAAVARGGWDLIVNSGAYTAVDKAEDDVVGAWQSNAVGPAVLAREAAKAGIPLIHVSTDYVFDGSKTSPYVESDTVHPIGVYGASKTAGEIAVRSAGGRNLILRTAWVVSSHGNNFVKTMLRLGAERPLLRVVNDQHGTPTPAREIAKTLVQIAPDLIAGKGAGETYHFVSGGEGTWFDLAQHVFDIAGSKGAKRPDLEPIPTSQYPTPAKRPANSRLATAKIQQDFGVAPHPWRDAVSEVVEELLSNKKAG
jgi:dTDP-4-dehydrorhamnose reductase